MKPKCKLTGTNGNVFALMGVCSKALRGAGLNEKVSEMNTRIMSAGSYDEALQIMMEYVEVE